MHASDWQPFSYQFMLSSMEGGVSSNRKAGMAGAVDSTALAALATTALVGRYIQVPAALAMQAREAPAIADPAATVVGADPIVPN